MTAEDVRGIMQAADPELLKFADLVREKFGARMIYLKTPGLVLGSRRCLEGAIVVSELRVKGGANESARL